MKLYLALGLVAARCSAQATNEESNLRGHVHTVVDGSATLADDIHLGAAEGQGTSCVTPLAVGQINWSDPQNCIDAGDDGKGSVNPVLCDGSIIQKFRLCEDGTVRSEKSQYCLTSTGTTSPLSMEVCEVFPSVNENQKWDTVQDQGGPGAPPPVPFMDNGIAQNLFNIRLASDGLYIASRDTYATAALSNETTSFYFRSRGSQIASGKLVNQESGECLNLEGGADLSESTNVNMRFDLEHRALRGERTDFFEVEWADSNGILGDAIRVPGNGNEIRKAAVVSKNSLGFRVKAVDTDAFFIDYLDVSTAGGTFKGFQFERNNFDGFCFSTHPGDFRPWRRCIGHDQSYECTDFCSDGTHQLVKNCASVSGTIQCGKIPEATRACNDDGDVAVLYENGELVDAVSDKCLEYFEAEKAVAYGKNGCRGQESQQWQQVLVEEETGFFSLFNPLSNSCFQTNDVSAKEACTDDDPQKWKFRPTNWRNPEGRWDLIASVQGGDGISHTVSQTISFSTGLSTSQTSSISTTIGASVSFFGVTVSPSVSSSISETFTTSMSSNSGESQSTTASCPSGDVALWQFHMTITSPFNESLDWGALLVACTSSTSPPICPPFSECANSECDLCVGIEEGNTEQVVEEWHLAQ